MRLSKTSLGREEGMTLVEIIVVLVIIGVVMTVLTGGLFGRGERAKATANKMKMEQLNSAIKEYQLMYNKIPSSLESLVRCTEETGASCIPIAEDRDLLDVWETPYVYTASNSTYTIKSLGSDKKDGGTGAAVDMTLTGP
jgi:general secretion pathway protein G